MNDYQFFPHWFDNTIHILGFETLFINLLLQPFKLQHVRKLFQFTS